MARRITVLGTGYLGTTHAACLADLGFEVLGVDVDPGRVEDLAAGRLPFHEPGLQPLLARGLRSGRLRFTTSFAEAADFGDVHFCCVGTPQQAGGRCRPVSAAELHRHARAAAQPAQPGRGEVHRPGGHGRHPR